MIDGFTIRLRGEFAHSIFKMPCLTNWEYKGVASTGEEKYQEIHHMLSNGTKIYFKYFGNSQIMLIQCSLTKYHLGNNFENLRFTQLVEAVYSLCDWLQFNPSQTETFLFEYGVTTTLPYSPDLLLCNMMSTQKKPFKLIEDSYYQCNLKTHQYWFKNYNKSTQHNVSTHAVERLLNLNIFRTEVHLEKGQPVNKMGIFSLADVLDKDKLVLLKNDHCKRIAAIFIHDWSIQITNLTREELINYANWGNRLYWQPLLGKGQRHRYEYQKGKAQQFYKKRNGILISQQLAEQVSKEWHILLNS